MPGIVAFTILITIFSLGEFVALKTKATLSTVLVVAFILLISFWMGMPVEIFESSALVPIGGIMIGILITGMGNMLDFAELKRQWRTVVVAALTVMIATAGVFFIGQFIIGRDFAMAGAPIFSGTSTASLIMNQTLSAQGRDELAIFIIMILACQYFVGIPTASQFLKIAARRFLKREDEHHLYRESEQTQIDTSVPKKRKLLQIPKDLERPTMSMAKLGMVTVLAFYTAELMQGAISYIVITLIYGTIFSELGFLEKNCLDNTNSYGFILFSSLIILFTNLPNATPELLLSLIVPITVTLGIGIISACIAGAVIGKLFKVETCMAICMCVTCTFGFPTTMYMANEVSLAIGKNTEEVKLLENYLRPKMITAGFVTGILSILLAGFVANII